MSMLSGSCWAQYAKLLSLQSKLFCVSLKGQWSMLVSGHTICSVCEQAVVSGGSQKLTAVLAELQASKSSSIALNSAHSL